MIAVGLVTKKRLLQAVVIASILPQIICALIALRFVEHEKQTNVIKENIFSHPKEAWSAFRYNIEFRHLSLASVLNYPVEEVYFQLKPALIAVLWLTWALGISRALDNLLGFLRYHFAGVITKRFGSLKTLLSQQIIGRLIMFGSVGLLSVASPVLLNINSFFFGVGETANDDLLHKEFTDKQRATMGSLNSLAGSLVYATLAFGIDLVADKLGPALKILILAVLSIVVVVLYANLFKKYA